MIMNRLSAACVAELLQVFFFWSPESGYFDWALIGCFLLQSLMTDCALLSVPLRFSRHFAESLTDAATFPHVVELQSEFQSSPAVCVVASEYRRSPSTSSPLTESRLLSLHLMKLLHSISSTLSSWSISLLQIAYGDFIIHTCSSSALMSTLISVLLYLDCRVPVTKINITDFVSLLILMRSFSFCWTWTFNTKPCTLYISKNIKQNRTVIRKNGLMLPFKPDGDLSSQTFTFVCNI